MEDRDGVERRTALAALRRALLVNGAVFLVRGALDLARPTSFFVPTGAPAHAVDTVRAVGVAYEALAVTQLGVAWRGDPGAVRAAGAGAMLFGAGMAVLALARRRPTGTTFDRVRYPAAAENAAVFLLYGSLLVRSRAASPPASPGGG